MRNNCSVLAPGFSNRCEMIGRFFGLPVGILAATMLVPLSCAFFLNEQDALIGFLIAVLISAFYAVIVLLALQNKNDNIGRKGRGAIFLRLSTFWFLLPIFAAIPFAMSGELDVASSYFESVSGFTTTGASVIDSPHQIARSLLLWRSLLQWLGGLSSLIIIAAFLLPLKLIEMGEGTPVSSNKGDTSISLEHITLMLLVPYGGLTLVCFMALLASNLSTFHALCMSLSLISTGGFISSDALEPNLFGKIIMVLFMLLGAVNFSYLCAISRGNFRFSRTASELRLLLCLWLFAALLLSISFYDNSMGRWVESVGAGLFVAASLLSTTAITSFDVATDYSVPLPLLLLLPVMGGCCFSTAGGIKLARILLVTRHSWRELEKLIHPSGVVPIRGDIGAPGMRTIWAYFGVFFVCLGIGASLLSFSGVAFLPALASATGALSNAGAMLHYLDSTTLGEHSYDDVTLLGKSVLIFLMVAGRVEILLLLGLFLPAYWRT